MTKYTCYYNNGTGWWEGPYVEEYENVHDARKANDVGYGVLIFEGEVPQGYNPNIHDLPAREQKENEWSDSLKK